jgi:hypothetical protein
MLLTKTNAFKIVLKCRAVSRGCVLKVELFPTEQRHEHEQKLAYTTHLVPFEPSVQYHFSHKYQEALNGIEGSGAWCAAG